nr:hypothetical protein [Koleobacter methoxysyntrophicus]
MPLKQSDIYKDANFMHFVELLAEHEDISISYSCLHTILTNADIKSPKKRRRFKSHRRRKRKPQEGLLFQMDVSPEDSDRDILYMLEEIFLTNYA